MTVRTPIKCETCNHYIITRILLGHNTNPSYVFNCPNCDEKIELSMNLFPERGSWEYIYKENCLKISTKEEANEAEEKGTIINLTAEIPIPNELKNTDFNIVPHLLMKQRDLFGKENKTIDPNKKAETVPSIHKNWKSLKRAISQTIKGKPKIAHRFINEYNFFYDKSGYDNDIFSELHDFFLFFLIPEKYKYIEKTLEVMKLDQEKYKDTYIDFFKYFIKNIFESNMEKVTDLIKKYMDNYEDLIPYMLYLRKEEEIPETTGSSSFNFDELKMFYGQAFELLSSLFEFITIVNNIHQGRAYDQLSTIPLSKYNTIDKAKRSDAFQMVDDFKHFSSEFDSTIRNASHHNNIELKDDKTILYKSGKPLVEREISIRDYLIKCNRIFINVISIYDLCLFTNEFSRVVIKDWGFK